MMIRSELQLIGIIVIILVALPLFTCTTSTIPSEPSCGSVMISPKRQKLELFENGTLSRDDYELVRTGIVKSVAVPVRNSSTCHLEICGFITGIRYLAAQGLCQRFTLNMISARYILKGFFMVSSMSCACNNRNQPGCENNTCSDTAPRWEGSQCAILYQENECQSCFFFPIILNNKEWFRSMNSVQIKSFIVRPGCSLGKMTKGFNDVDLEKPKIELFSGIARSDAGPKFHKDSENFTCACEEPGAEPDVQLYQVSGSTVKQLTGLTNGTKTKPIDPTPNVTDFEETTELILHDNTTSTSDANFGEEIHDTQQMWLVYGTLGFVGLCLLFVGGGIMMKYFIQRKPVQETEETKIGSVVETHEMELMGDYGRSEGEEIKLMQPFNEIMAELKKHIDATIKEARKDWEETQLPMSSQQNESASGNNDEVTLLQRFHQVCSSNLDRHSFEIGRRKLGSGHFGIVHQGTFHPPDGHDLFPEGETQVAVKELKTSTRPSSVNSFLREIKIFQVIGSHENILPFVGACCHNGELFILTKFCEKGSLKDYLMEEMRSRILQQNVGQSSRGNTGDSYISNGDVVIHTNTDINIILGSKDLYQFLKWCEQIAAGMDFLNTEKNIIHVDLAVRNILLTNDLVAKISDFGLSKEKILEKDYAQSLLSGKFPMNSIAPECVRQVEPLTLETRVMKFIDVYAYGCTLWEIFNLGTDNGHYFEATRQLQRI